MTALSLSKLPVATGHFHLTHRMPMWIAICKGWFEEEGLEVDLPVTGDDDLSEAGIIRGDFPVVFDLRTDRVLQLIGRGAPLRIVGGYRNVFPFDFIGPKGATSIAQLRGRRVALAEPEGIGTMHVRKALSRAGLDPERDVELKVIGMTPDQVRALHDGDVDAVYVWKHYGEQLVSEGYPLLMNFADAYPNGYQERVNVARFDLIQEHPDTVGAYLKGVVRGCRFINDARPNFQEILELMRRLAEVDIAAGGERAEEAESNLKYHDDPREIINFPYPRDGGISEQGLLTTLLEEQEHGRVPADLTVDQVADVSFAKSAARQVDARFGTGNYQ